MFELTFLGHQSWLIRGGSTAILVDPLLGQSFGHGGLLGRIAPARIIDLDAMPALDAVILTHEHDDHFDLPSLARIDRRVPIYLSSRSSTAAFTILREMGFRVEPLRPATELRVARLGVRTFCVDHQAAGQGDEWDVIPLLVWDLEGHGSLWTSVDVRPRDADLASLREHAKPGVWAYANNSSWARFQAISAPSEPGFGFDDDDRAHIVAAALARFDRLRDAWGGLEATLVCGGGWALTGEAARFTSSLFPLTNAELAAAMATHAPGVHCAAATPGLSLGFVDGRLARVDSRCAFVSPVSTDAAPLPGPATPGAVLHDYSPACGRRQLEADEREALVAGLDDLARHLHGGRVFRQLCSLPEHIDRPHTGTWGPEDPDPLEAAVALALRDDGADMVLRYVPSACRFELDPRPEPMTRFASGLECWASDLLALVRGEIGPSALCYAGRLRHWNHAPGQLHVSPALLWTFAHPLRRPEAALALYRRLLA